MAFLAPAVSAISGIFGIVQGIMGLTGSKKESAPAVQPLPEAPKEADAAAEAQAEAKKKRIRSLLSGGETNVTRGQALSTPEGLGLKSLLGQ